MVTLIGKQIKMDALPPPRSRGTDWKSVCESVRPGYAQAIETNYGTLKTAILRLEHAKKLRVGEYDARVVREGKKLTVYVVRNKEPRGRASTSGKPKRREGPTMAQVKEFILKQPDFQHTLPDIQESLYGHNLSARDDSPAYHRSYNLAKRARKIIAQENKVEFVEQLRNDGVKMYRVHKQ
jgi:hypothetical protein